MSWNEHRLKVQITESLDFGQFNSSCCQMPLRISFNSVQKSHFRLVAPISSPCVMVTHLFIKPDTLAVAACQVPLVVSDTCGRNVGTGSSRRVPNFNTHLVWRHGGPARCAASNPRSPACGLGCTTEFAFGTELWPFFSLLGFTTGGCGRRLELVGTVAAVLQDVWRRGGVLLQGVRQPRATERGQILRGTEGPVSVLQHAALRQRRWESARGSFQGTPRKAADRLYLHHIWSLWSTATSHFTLTENIMREHSAPDIAFKKMQKKTATARVSIPS